MSSLRLALKQSLEEANPSIKEREQEKKKKQRQKQRLRDDSDSDDSSDDDNDHGNHKTKTSKTVIISSSRDVEGDGLVIKRKRGRPKGSTNKKKLDDSPNKVTSSVGSNANKHRTTQQSTSNDKEIKLIKKKKGLVVKENEKDEGDGKRDVLKAGIRKKKKKKNNKSKDKDQLTHHLKQSSPDESDNNSISNSEQELDSNSSSGDSSSESSGSDSTGSSSSDSSSDGSDAESLSNDNSSSSSSSSDSDSPPFSPSQRSPLKSPQKKEHDGKVLNQTNDVDDEEEDDSSDDEHIAMDGVFDSERSSDDEERPGGDRVIKKKRSSLSTESLMSIDDANSQQLSKMKKKKKTISMASSQLSSDSKNQVNLSSSTKSIGTIHSKSSRDFSEQKQKHNTKVNDEEEESVGMKTSNTFSSVSITTDRNGNPITKKRKQKSVMPPTMEVLAWVMGMSQSQQRSEIRIGMRVKVRFTKPKVKWYGGVVTLVGSTGAKIRILYDDGTSESTHFPDKEIVVDDTGNGRHEVNADAFKPSKLLFGANIPMRIDSTSTRTPSVTSTDKNSKQKKEDSESNTKDSTVLSLGSPKKSNVTTDNNKVLSVPESQQQQLHPLESRENANVEKDNSKFDNVVDSQNESVGSTPVKAISALSVSPKVHVDETTSTVEDQTLSVTTKARQMVEVDVSTKSEMADKIELEGELRKY